MSYLAHLQNMGSLNGANGGENVECAVAFASFIDVYTPGALSRFTQAVPIGPKPMFLKWYGLNDDVVLPEQS
jgi:hypothetical protein